MDASRNAPGIMAWTRQGVLAAAVVAVLVPPLSSCRTLMVPEGSLPRYHGNRVVVDGSLDEPEHRQAPFTAVFQAVSRPGAAVPGTKAWLGWNGDGLWFAFAAADGEIVASPPGEDEHAVDAQDRVEVFIWPEGSARYFCVEVAPGGAVHDYSARYYRQFDDAWRPHGARFAARRTSGGYTVEGFLPVSALHEMGFRDWGSGTRFRLGLFRADFRPGAAGDPHWLTWIDPRLPQADFHVPGAFARVVLHP